MGVVSSVAAADAEEVGDAVWVDPSSSSTAGVDVGINVPVTDESSATSGAGVGVSTDLERGRD